jgi:hypothetical protein
MAGSSTVLPPFYKALERFFNERFEFYGRHLVLQPDQTTTGGTPNAAGETADAQTVAQQLGSFASLSYSGTSGAEYIYYDELARQHVLSVATNPTWSTEEDRVRYAPYEWGILPGGNDVGEEELAGYICTQLGHGSAAYAGPPYAGQPRKYGLMIGNSFGYQADPSELISVLGGCGISLAAQAVVTGGAGGSASDNEQSAHSAILQYKAQGVTTLICLCEGLAAGVYYTPAATDESYFPEWVLSSYVENDMDWAGASASKPQSVHWLGISQWNKALPPDQEPVTWAVREGDPSFTWGGSYDTSEPGNPNAAANSAAGPYQDPYMAQHYNYADLLLLASGIQMAGAKLTPAAFQAGLFRTSFPNPGCDGPPYYQACVGFPGVHYMFQSAAIIWWSPSATSYSHWLDSASGGSWCYADLGRRYPLRSWPRGPRPVFTGPCR